MMTVAGNAATKQSPLTLAVEDRQSEIDAIVDEMVRRTISVARFDLKNGIKHGAVALFGVVGGPVLEALNHKLYEAVQDLARVEGGGR